MDCLQNKTIREERTAPEVSVMTCLFGRLLQKLRQIDTFGVMLSAKTR
jgi:hypothetical protein